MCVSVGGAIVLWRLATDFVFDILCSVPGGVEGVGLLVGWSPLLCDSLLHGAGQNNIQIRVPFPFVSLV